MRNSDSDFDRIDGLGRKFEGAGRYPLVRAPVSRNNDSRADRNSELCDFAEGVACVPFRREYRVCNLVARRRTGMDAWQRPDPPIRPCAVE